MLEFDVANGAAADLSCRRTQDQLVGWMKAGLVWGLWLATPCVTLTRARRANTAGLPRPLRSSALPHGLPGLTEAEQVQVRDANKLIAFAGRLLALAARVGVIAGEENPNTSTLWCFPDRRKLLDRHYHAFVDFCFSGLPARKRTRLL